jgi:hypothetical protein
MNNVKSYTNKELLDFVKAMPDFKGIPSGYWIQSVRSKEDARDKFDDKRYLWKGENFIDVSSITTNKGDKGTAVMCTGWHYDVYAPSDGVKVRHHKGKSRCLRQVKSIPYRRDYTKDGKTNPTSEIFTDIIHMNYHSATYDLSSKVIKVNIGGWSEGCQVENNTPKFVNLLDTVEHQALITYCLIDEF